MNKDLEKQIREYVDGELPTNYWPPLWMGELLREIDCLRQSISEFECLYPQTCPGDCNHCQIKRKHERTESNLSTSKQP